jgi:hypothetical protein
MLQLQKAALNAAIFNKSATFQMLALNLGPMLQNAIANSVGFLQRDNATVTIAREPHPRKILIVLLSQKTMTLGCTNERSNY